MHKHPASPRSQSTSSGHSFPCFVASISISPASLAWRCHTSPGLRTEYARCGLASSRHSAISAKPASQKATGHVHLTNFFARSFLMCPHLPKFFCRWKFRISAERDISACQRLLGPRHRYSTGDPSAPVVLQNHPQLPQQQGKMASIQYHPILR
ncbi:hypothetical protein MPH_05779 [Macrophomina phaseolina MS6]|uniref:Uncharacterized protein n=1 Tax=Macrophomina phaseolina (strain MS6) TaxID=1126212 RepID=K2S370_MACPH|nr:hypothetical protein MPH_05779 [Macrophomina phaseolina MS6]